MFRENLDRGNETIYPMGGDQPGSEAGRGSFDLQLQLKISAGAAALR